MNFDPFADLDDPVRVSQAGGERGREGREEGREGGRSFVCSCKNTIATFSLTFMYCT